MSFLSENDFIEVVVAHIRSHGVAYWNDIYKVIHQNFTLSSEDLEAVGGYEHRYHSQAMNLKSNKSIIRRFNDIVQVRGGFATRTFATENNLYVTDDGVDLSTRGQRARSRAQVSRELILKVLSQYYLKIKNTLTPAAVQRLRANREQIVQEIIGCHPGNDENEIEALVIEQFEVYSH